MFPPNQDDAQIFFQFNYAHQEDFIQQDLIPDHASLDGCDLLNNNMSPKGRQINNKLATADNPYGETNCKTNDDDRTKKKITRKEIERQRREHMAKLLASLRSLLPLESIKGKRSVSDNIGEAVNHIKQMKIKIQDLTEERDKLKQFTDLEALNQRNKSALTNCVSIHHYLGGMEIVINRDLRGEDLLLSGVLKVILEDGHNVVRCFSTRTNEGQYHTIHTEVCDPTCTDPLELQQKLNDIILPP